LGACDAIEPAGARKRGILAEGFLVESGVLQSSLPVSRTAALVALHTAVALFGFAALFGKWVALPPVEIVLGRTLVAAATLALVQRVQRLSPIRPGYGVALNGGMLALHWVTFFAAVQWAGVAVALLAFASFPAFVLALESVERRSAPDRVEAGAIILVVIGLALLVPDFRWSSAALQGYACGIASGLTFAILTVRSRRAVIGYGAVNLALWQNVFAALCLAPFALAGAATIAPTAADVVLLAVLGVACTALAHTLFIASMRRVSAHTASVVSVLEPVYGIALAAVLIGVRLDARTATGMLLILAAALLATRHAKR
jgi:drug/metabolite transporter (DMT)-like permease